MRPKKLVPALSVLSFLCAGALTTGGCVDNRTSLFIDGVLGFAPGDSCDIEVSLSADLQVAGSYDPGAGDPYTAYLIIANGLQPLGDKNRLRPETSRIQLEGAEINITNLDGGSVAAFTIPFTVTVHPSDSKDPGLIAVPVTLIPSAVGVGLPTGASYEVSVQVFGRTLGGKKVESGEFQYPVTVVPPWTFGLCGDNTAALDEDSIHPCGFGMIDGYSRPCGPIRDGNCANCGP